MHDAPFVHMNVILRKPILVLRPYSCVFSEEKTNTSCIVFDLTRSWLETAIYRDRGDHANHCIVNDVLRRYVIVGL